MVTISEWWLARRAWKHQGRLSRQDRAKVTAWRDAIRAMPIEDVRARIASTRSMTSAEVVARQKAERRKRAEIAAARIRDKH